MTQNYHGNSSISSNLSLKVLLRMMVEFRASNISKRNQHLSLLLLAFQSILSSLLLMSSCIQLSFVSIIAKYTKLCHILNGFIVFML